MLPGGTLGCAASGTATCKDAFRAAARARVLALSSEEAAEKSRRIRERVVACREFVEARCLACFLSARGEPDTAAIVHTCWEHGKMVYVPAWMHGSSSYGLAALDRGTELIRGRLGIREPACPFWMGEEAADLVIVPGLAFDGRGGRVGHGRGYYDAILRRSCCRGSRRMGLAFEVQIFGQVPMEEWDVRMDMVVTESRMILTAQ